jgi:hypothetical protein
MRAPLAERPIATLDSRGVPHKLGPGPERPFITKV